jgi:pimeloyl-ACP methyl ester carboxylesterase
MEFVSKSGIRGYFDKRGTGEKVLLVHGYCEDSHIWQATAGLLSSNYCVMTPDLPGFGKSERPPEGWGMEDYADWLAELVDAEFEGQCWYFGHSMGGYVGLAFAKNHPEKLKGFGLVNSHTGADSEEKKANRRKFREFVGKHGLEPVLRELYRGLFPEEFLQKHPEVLTKFMEQGGKYEPKGIFRAAEAMMARPDRADIWAGLQIPCLHISGEKDSMIPLETSLKQAILPDSVMVEVMRDTGHMGPTEAPEAIAGYLQKFLVQSLNLIEN